MGGGEGRAPGGPRAASPPFRSPVHDPTRNHLRGLHAPPERARRDPRPSRRSPPAGYGLGAARLGKIAMIAQQVAADGGREYVDVRALLLDPVDLRGIPWRDAADRTRWAPPVFLPPTGDTGLWLPPDGGAICLEKSVACSGRPVRPTTITRTDSTSGWGNNRGKVTSSTDDAALSMNMVSVRSVASSPPSVRPPAFRS